MKPAHQPLASVLINSFNYGRFLREAIESALCQTYANVEVIVVDDGSTDDSREVIASFGNRILSVLKENGGQSSALNRGFEVSSGEWVHLLDADDVFLAEKVQRLMQLASGHPSAGMIAHDLAYCATDGSPLEFAPPYISKLALVDDRQLALRGKLSVSLPATSGISVRRDVFRSILPIPEDIRIGTDNYLKWVILSLAPVLTVPELLAKQRIHGDNVATILAESGGKDARVRLALYNAKLTYHMSKQHPHLTKLAWKQYGRILYGLRSSRTEESRLVEEEIRTSYNVAQNSASCLFYTMAAFTKAYVEDLLGSRRRA